MARTATVSGPFPSSATPPLLPRPAKRGRERKRGRKGERKGEKREGGREWREWTGRGRRGRERGGRNAMLRERAF
eukprot:2327380-Rhodomonas_salina.3